MSFRKVLSLVVSLGLLAGLAPVQAQEAKSAPVAAAPQATDPSQIEGGVPRYVLPETPEQRRTRLATAEDPGLDPDLNKVWWRYSKPYKIHKFEKKWAKYGDDPRFVRPFANVNFTEEVYQENDKYVWVWIEEIDYEAQKKEVEEAQRAAQYTPVSDEGVAYFEMLREDFKPLEPAKSNVKIKFEESSAGLPTGGSWRNSLDVADMNEDGHVDLIFPPQRGPAGPPEIFLGDGKGGWTHWKITWPRAFNYGSVVAADFNKDKHVDLAFGVHLTGLVVLLGDGKGNFREVIEGLPKNFPTRRIHVTDLDRDGWLDIVTISEGPVGRGADIRGEGYSNLRGYLNKNRGEAWEGFNISELGHPVGGDWLGVANLNGDRFPDFIGSSVYFNGISTIWVSKGKPSSYELLDGKGSIVPFRSYYHALTAGKFTSKDRDDAIVSFVRIWPGNLDPTLVPQPPLKNVVGLDRISFVNGQPKRTAVARWSGTTRIPGMGNGDFDNDGKRDVIVTRMEPREGIILLGDGVGSFKRAVVEGLNLSGLRNYDVTVTDLNGDKLSDVVVMYEAESSTALSRKNGKVQVFLNRGVVAAE
jgi:FG-GAP-like repeat